MNYFRGIFRQNEGENRSVLNVRENRRQILTTKLPKRIILEQSRKIFLAAGGTGGHFFPAIAVGEELIKRGYEVHIITDLRCKKFISTDLKLISHIIDLPQYSTKPLKKIIFLFKLLAGLCKAAILLIYFKPKSIVGFGGYPVLPLMTASRLFKVPIVIHEQNSVLGKVNELASRFAKKIATSYSQVKNLDATDSDKIIFIGNVVRANIREYPIKTDFNNDIFRIFVFGGSQGAKIFSSLIPETVKIMLRQEPTLKVHITQQVAQDDYAQLKQDYSKLNISYQLSEFFDDMGTEYNNAELVIARAGASTIAELEYVGLPAILIPFPTSSQNHQLYNAKLLAADKAGWYFEQEKISAATLAQEILHLAKNRDILAKASRNLLKRKQEGYKILADVVESVS